MKQYNQLAQDIAYTDLEAQYDDCAKQLLANPPLLARILKCTVPEFRNMKEDDIITCIEDIQYAVSAMPGETISHITGLPQESRIHGEGTIYYDIRFMARAPDRRKMKFHIRFDLEPMKEARYPYAVMNRAQVNTARMLSEQVGNVIRKMEYDRAQPVYSIWLMLSTTGANANTVTLFSQLEQHNITGNYIRDKREKNLMNIVIICLPAEGQADESQLTELTGPFTAVFSDTMTPEEKMSVLEKYGIRTTETMKAKVREMGRLSEGIYERGEMQGYQAGSAFGMKKSRTESALRMIQAGKYDDKEIADITGLNKEEVEELKKHRS